MGKLKQSLIDTPLEDQTDPRDTGEYGQPDEPSASDWAISELNNAIITLEKNGATGYVSELKEYRQRIQAVIEKTVKPF